MSKKENTLSADIMQCVWDIAQYLPLSFDGRYGWARRLRKLSNKEYYDVLYSLKKRGAVKFITKEGKKFIQLTQKGVLETLLAKSAIHKTAAWDGKWRVFIFDIPEDAHKERDRLRFLLKRKGFHMLQASVFIHPYSLNRDAIAYLTESGLIKYIRILKVEEMDNDADLRKVFDL